MTSGQGESFIESRPRGLRVGLLGIAACLSLHASAQVQQAPGGTSGAQNIGGAASAQPSPAMQAHLERLAILTQEKNNLLAQRPQLEKVGDKTLLARLDADLQGIDREIARTVKEPIYEIKRTSEGPASSVSAPPGAVNPAQPAASVVVTYESWDVFKNFGKKGSPQ
jgi:hypothetical protein